MLDQIRETCDYLREKALRPEVGVILGTGLGDTFLKEIQEPVVIPYREIPNFPLPTMTYHVGNLIFGRVGGKGVVAMQGRFHYYEGYSMQQITFPVRVMKLLGVSQLLISNAGGNMNPKWKKGELMLLDDHINQQPDNPLRGIDQTEWENPFPDMSQPYAQTLNERLTAIALRNNITLHRGVYVAVGGPNLETRAEYRFLRAIGADVVGMSTVPEVIVANHVRLPCCAVSVLTDDCDPDNLKPVSIQEIIEVAARAEPHLTRLFTELIASL
jgi:purine-nucleoside phosphorylase